MTDHPKGNKRDNLTTRGKHPLKCRKNLAHIFEIRSSDSWDKVNDLLNVLEKRTLQLNEYFSMQLSDVVVLQFFRLYEKVVQASKFEVA